MIVDFKKITPTTNLKINNIIAKYPIIGKCCDKFDVENHNEISYYRILAFNIEQILNLQPLLNAIIDENYTTLLHPINKNRNDLDNGFWWVNSSK